MSAQKYKQKNEFPERELRDLASRFEVIHKKCHKRFRCSCGDANKIFIELRTLIRDKTRFFPFNKERYAPDMDELTLYSIEGEVPADRNVIARVTNVKTLRFLSRYAGIYNNQLGLQENQLGNDLVDAHSKVCDCNTWLQWTFTKVRKPCLNKLIEKVPHHNIVAMALIAYAIQNVFIERNELTATHNVFNDYWDRQTNIKLMSRNYTKDRKRELRNYKKSEFVTLMEERFNRAIRPLKLEFVDLFESNGEMKSTIFVEGDPAKLFQCKQCNKYFNGLYSGHCTDLDMRVMRHQFCRPCFRHIVISQKACYNYNYELDRIYFKCPFAYCNHVIVIDKTIDRYWNRNTRYQLYDMAIDYRLTQLKDDAKNLK
uniref:Uncharacterized protein n=1 Tax=Acrobeloides nanus TaxID=290746 RepID=A0A914C1M9_9BILA